MTRTYKERLEQVFPFILLGIFILLLIRFSMLSKEEVRRLEEVYEDENYDLFY